MNDVTSIWNHLKSVHLSLHKSKHSVGFRVTNVSYVVPPVTSFSILLRWQLSLSPPTSPKPKYEYVTSSPMNRCVTRLSTSFRYLLLTTEQWNKARQRHINPPSYFEYFLIPNENPYSLLLPTPMKTHIPHRHQHEDLLPSHKLQRLFSRLQESSSQTNKHPHASTQTHPISYGT